MELADQIIKRIANANGAEPFVMRQRIEQMLQSIISDPISTCPTLTDLIPGDKSAMDEMIIALEQELYDALMPRLIGWEWDGTGYRNTALLKIQFCNVCFSSEALYIGGLHNTEYT